MRILREANLLTKHGRGVAAARMTHQDAAYVLVALAVAKSWSDVLRQVERFSAARLSRSTSLSGMAQQLSMGLGVSFSAALLQVIAGPGALPSPNVFRLVLICVALITLAAGPAFLLLRAEDGADVSGFRPVAVDPM